MGMAIKRIFRLTCHFSTCTLVPSLADTLVLVRHQNKDFRVDHTPQVLAEQILCMSLAPRPPCGGRDSFTSGHASHRNH